MADKDLQGQETWPKVLARRGVHFPGLDKGLALAEKQMPGRETWPKVLARPGVHFPGLDKGLASGVGLAFLRARENKQTTTYEAMARCKNQNRLQAGDRSMPRST